MTVEICGTCGQTRAWHEQHQPRHLFTMDGETGLKEPEPPKQLPSTRGDPILRLVMIRKGLITEADLGIAEDWVMKAQQRGQALLVLPDESGQLEYKLIELSQVGKELFG